MSYPKLEYFYGDIYNHTICAKLIKPHGIFIHKCYIVFKQGYKEAGYLLPLTQSVVYKNVGL